MLGSFRLPSSVVLVVLLTLAQTTLGAAAPLPQSTPELVATLGRGMIRDSAWSPDGKTFAVLATVGVWLYDMTQPEQEPVLMSGKNDGGNALAFSPDGKWIAVAETDFSVSMWSVDGSEEMRVLEGHRDHLIVYDLGTSGVYDLAFNRDGSLLVSVGLDGQVVRWEVAKGTQGKPVLEYLAGSVQFSPTDPSLVMLQDFNFHSAILFDATLDDSPLTTIDQSAYEHIIFSPDGSSVLALTECGIDVIDIKNPSRVTQLPLPCEQQAVNLAVNPQTSEMAISRPEGVVTIENPEEEAIITTVQALTRHAANVEFSPDGRYLALQASSSIRIYDTTRWSVVVTADDYPGYQLDLAASPDGSWFASASTDGLLRVWDSATLQLRFAIPQCFNGGIIYAMSFYIDVSPDGKLLAAGCDEVVRVWEMETQRQVFETPANGGYAAFNAQGNWLAVQTHVNANDNDPISIRLYDVNSWSLVQAMRGHLWLVDFLPQSDQLVVGDTSQAGSSRLGVLDIASGELQYTLTTIKRWFSPQSVSISATGQLFWFDGGNTFSCALMDCASPRQLSDTDDCEYGQALSTSTTILALSLGNCAEQAIIRLLDISSGAVLGEIPHKAAHGNVTLLQENRLLAGNGATIRIYELR